jgi:hypothetical protein
MKALVVWRELVLELEAVNWLCSLRPARAIQTSVRAKSVGYVYADDKKEVFEGRDFKSFQVVVSSFSFSVRVSEAEYRGEQPAECLLSGITSSTTRAEDIFWIAAGWK